MLITKCKCCGQIITAQPMPKGFYLLEQDLPMDEEMFKSGWKITNKDGKIKWIDDQTFIHSFNFLDEKGSDSAIPNN